MVTSIETFFGELPQLNEKMSGNYYYRGQSNIAFKLKPSVFRETLDEHDIYNLIMTECAHEFSDCILHNEILSKMQHYGVPTRLLDITTNPLVALYFACDDKEHKGEDGVIFVIETKKSNVKNYDSDAISILSSLPRFTADEKDEMLFLAQKRCEKNNEGTYKNSDIKDFNNEKIIRRLLHEIKKEKPAFENIINPNDLMTNFIFLPRKINARIIRQSGAFIIFGLKEEEYICKRKIPIQKNSKQHIIDQLSCFGISKATLHPELYKVAEFIKEKYSRNN
ncbi:MAG: FRG domain-containing protein [Syntrophomonas sp.]